MSTPSIPSNIFVGQFSDLTCMPLQVFFIVLFGVKVTYDPSNIS
jgi:hypothetical protein